MRNAATLILAPHCDDAAFSLGGALLQRFFPEPVVVATVFTQSNYTLRRKTNNSAEEVTGIRKWEEERFVWSIGARWIDLDLPEAFLRGYATLRDIFSAATSEDPIRHDLSETIQSLIESVRAPLVGLPLGLGGHVDHRLVREAGVAALDASPHQVFWYEDLPYAARLPAPEIEIAVRKCCPLAAAQWIPIRQVLRDKLLTLRTYRSQVSLDEVQAVRRHACRISDAQTGASERIWTIATVTGEHVRSSSCYGVE